jgi:predicted RNA-binding Zn ribbon-like protein
MTNQTAPGQLEDLREFVNTLDIDDGIEELTSPEALAAWLEPRDLLVEGADVGQPELERALELRESFRRLLLANNGGERDPAAIESLNHVAEEANISVRFDPDGHPVLAIAGEGEGAVLAPLVAIAYESMVAGTWSRLKVCPADDCQWAFYDHSKNHSGTWCSMEVCGNRAKVRRYRQRRDASKSKSSS